MSETLHTLVSEHDRSALRQITTAEIDSGLEHKLTYFLGKFEGGFPAALDDAIAFCKEHALLDRDDLSDEVLQMLQRVSCHAGTGYKRRRTRTSKGTPTRYTKGRPAVPKLHIDRFTMMEAFLEKSAARGEKEDILAAARAIGDRQWDAFRKSYWKVVRGNLYDGHYVPEYGNTPTKGD